MRALTEELFRFSVVLSSRPLSPVPLSLNRALEEGLAAYYGALTERGIVPSVRMPDAPVMRELDSGALSRVFGNILSNALKYSAGDLTVELDEAGTVAFSNTAPGMTPVLAQKLFDQFFTVETGLGLSIARGLTERMGGTISARCRDGVLTVTVSFPR